jgi:hypothetical protein
VRQSCLSSLLQGHLAPDLTHELLLVHSLLDKSLVIFYMLLGMHQFLDEVTIFVQEKGHAVVRVDLDLLVHAQIVVDPKFKTTFELLLVDLGILCHEALVTNLSDIDVLHQVKAHQILLLDVFLNLLQVLLC